MYLLMFTCTEIRWSFLSPYTALIYQAQILSSAIQNPTFLITGVLSKSVFEGMVGEFDDRPPSESKLQFLFFPSYVFLIQESFQGCVDFEFFFSLWIEKTTAASQEIRSNMFKLLQELCGSFLTVQMMFVMIIYCIYPWYLQGKYLAISSI